MKIKIHKVLYDYLLINLTVERPDLAKRIKQEKEGIKFVIDISEDTACEIRDWAGSKLQKLGFEADYNLTRQGEYLEDIIDLLFV